MIIGVDAYCLHEKQNTGIGTLTLNLLKALSKIDNDNIYILFTPAITHNEDAKEIVANKNFKIIEYKGFFGNYRRLWLQDPLLTYKIVKEKVEIFWGGGEYIPLWLPGKIITIVSIHDVVFAMYPETIKVADKFLYHTLFLACLKRTNAIITVSENSKQEIIHYLHPNKPIFVAYNGIPISKYKSENKEKKGNYILFVGTLQPRKNLINVIKAFELLYKDINVDLIIVGASGWKNSSIRSLVESLDSTIQNKIKFMGYIDNQSLVKIYQKAKVFIAPSLHEGFGLIILEALASGTPVVTSPRGAIQEVFKDSVEYADPLNPHDIKDKIKEILKSKNKQKKMIEYGLHYAKQFDIMNTAQRYKQIFLEVGSKV